VRGVAGIIERELLAGSGEHSQDVRRSETTMENHLGRKVIIGAVLLVVAIALTVMAMMRPKHGAGGAGGTPEVAVIQVEQKDVPIYHQWIGTLEGFVNADVRGQVTGYLLRQDYKEGNYVEQGQLLFEIDPRPFQAALDASEGELATATAQLANAEAIQVRTQLDVERYTPLAKEQAASQQDLDNAVQNNLAAKATVATARAQIKTAEAAVESARLNLGFTRLTAPVNGIAGKAQLQVGALISQSSGAVTTVSTVDPIKVYFTVSESEYLDFNRRFPTELVRQEEFKRTPLDLVLADGTTYAHQGTIDFADRAVNQGTGAILIAGLFPNEGNILRPGGYGRVRASTRTEKNALLVPQRAVTELQGSYQVAVVGSDNKIKIETVEVGERIGSQWIISKGLQPGERVVAEGTQKVRPGMQVNPKPYAPPSTEAKGQ
jgi:RND family efflux transporter MFP subunit